MCMPHSNRICVQGCAQMSVKYHVMHMCVLYIAIICKVEILLSLGLVDVTAVVHEEEKFSSLLQGLPKGFRAEKV